MNIVQLSGILLAAASLVLLLTSRAQLGKSFAVTTQAKELVTSGLYSKIRHPMYLFVDLTIIGIALAVQRWWVGIPLVALVPSQTWKAGLESNALRDKFGERYEAYRQGTWF